MGDLLKTVGTIRLEFFDPKYKQQLENYYLTEEHNQFTSHPQNAIGLCEEEEGRAPVLILSDDQTAGFFVLHGWEGVKEFYGNQKALLLRSYSVDSSFQGKGIAKHSLKLLPSFVKEHFPEINEIILAFNLNNLVAQHVYKSSGFVDKGIRAMGRKGEMYILHLEL
jgi:RimJ/RimL family protein N-acetyltransferase